MVTKPQNHVTRHLASLGAAMTDSLPILSRTELERLEAIHKPRCLRRNETVEDHLRYAGKVELVQDLRAAFEQSLAEDEEDPSLVDGDWAGQ